MQQEPLTPLVSVIVPAYNHERYVQETIRSIIAQTYMNIELLVTDDGSTDGTFAKISEFENECRARFAAVRFATQKNAGICATLNSLLADAHGEFVYPIASDDVAEPRAIETLLGCFDSSDIVFAVGDNSIIDSDSNITGWGTDRNIDDGKIVFDSWWDYNCYWRPELRRLGENFGSYESLVRGPYITNGYLIRRSALLEAGGWQDGTLDDWYMQLQLAKLGRFKFINEKLCRYRWHGMNTVHQKDKMRKLLAMTKKYEEKSVLKYGEPALINIYYKNISFQHGFYGALNQLIAGHREYKDDFCEYYKKLRHPTKKQRFFYLISFVPFTFALLRFYRRIFVKQDVECY